MLEAVPTSIERPASSPSSGLRPLRIDDLSMFKDLDAVPAARSILRRRLLTADLTACITAWLLILPVSLERPAHRGTLATLGLTLVAAAATVFALAVLDLYRARVCAVGSVARRRLAVASLAAPLLVTEIDRRAGIAPSATSVWVGASATFFALVVSREIFEQWLRASRARGRFIRAVIVAGDRGEVAQIVRLLEAHPEAGCRAVAWVGPAPDGPPDEALATAPWLGPVERLTTASDLAGVSGVVAGPSLATSATFREISRELHAAGVHVQVSCGMWGIASRRLRTVPVAHEAFFYLEPGSDFGRKRIKRVLDLVIAATVLVITSPILLVAAIAIKLHDGGPIFFRQVRIGLGGQPFELRKLRTMAVDAESRLDALLARNERSGPLFKLASDPRVTPVGHVLRATSIDELPQLLDVLSGRLSIVGPRPALPHEVENFDDALLARHQVPPGVTGLWQVEARHNPSFDAYRHLDLFYVENWTLGMDLVILLATLKTVVADSAGALVGWLGKHRDDEASATPWA